MKKKQPDVKKRRHRRVVKTPKHISMYPPSTRFIPLTEWNYHHAFPPVGGLRHLVFYRKKKKFEKVIKRLGRKIYIDEREFFRWFNEQDAVDLEVKEA